MMLFAALHESALAHDIISLPHSKKVAFGRKQTSSGRRNPQRRSKLTRSELPAMARNSGFA